MGRRPCCAKGVNRGAWSLQEDEILINFIKNHGQGRWSTVPQKAGLNRCGKSCRHRWLNYLSPDIKRGEISADEEDLIIRLHSLLGNRWALIAKRLPGRTANEIKNYWNTNLAKKSYAKRSKLTLKLFQPVEEKLIDQEPELKCSKTPLIRPHETQLVSQNEIMVPLDDDSFNFLMQIDDLLIGEPVADFPHNQDQKMINLEKSSINDVTDDDNVLSLSKDLENIEEKDIQIQPSLYLELKRLASFLELEEGEWNE